MLYGNAYQIVHFDILQLIRLRAELLHNTAQYRTL